MTIPNSCPNEAQERLIGAIRGLDTARGLATLHGSVQEVIGPSSTLVYTKEERTQLGHILDMAEPERSEAALRKLWADKRAREAGTLSAWRSRMTGCLAALRRLDDRQAASVAALGASGRVLAAVGSAVNRAADAARREGRPLDGDPAYVGLAVLTAITEAVQPPPKAKREGLARIRAITDQIGRLATAAEKAAAEEGLRIGRFVANVDRAVAAALAAAEASVATDATATDATATDATATDATATDATATDATKPTQTKKRRISG